MFIAGQVGTSSCENDEYEILVDEKICRYDATNHFEGEFETSDCWNYDVGFVGCFRNLDNKVYFSNCGGNGNYPENSPICVPGKIFI